MFKDKEHHKIGLFGFYKYGNYGDDLMAVLVARELELLGYSFSVFGILPSIADEFGFSRSETVEELLDGADAVVFGGGGAFLTSDATAFHEDIMRLCELCRKRSIPIIMISVGGDNRSLKHLPEPRRQLLKDAQFISFRNQEDESLVSKMTGVHSIHSDIVWTAVQKLGVAPETSKRRPILIDYALTERSSIKWFLKILVTLLSIFRRDCEVRYFSTAHREIDPVAVDIIQYERIGSFTQQISSALLIVTPRLHAGLVALSQGVPVMLLAPHGKSRLLFERLGLNDFIFKGATRALRLGWMLLKHNFIDDCRIRFRSIDCSLHINDGCNHYLNLGKHLSKCLNNKPVRQNSE